MNRVAVYGTLKAGYFNYEIHLKGKRPVHVLVSELPYELYANDEYPMLIPSRDGTRHPVAIEVFEVGDEKLSELDALERPYGYWRETVYVNELDQAVELYVHAAPAPNGFARVSSGDWQE